LRPKFAIWKNFSECLARLCCLGTAWRADKKQDQKKEAE
jgi:hypothetical protein